MFDSLTLAPALLCTQNHLLISADPGSCALSQTPYDAHMHSHLRAHKGFITERKIALKYTGTGYNYAVMGREGSETGLGVCIVSLAFRDTKHY